MSSKLRIYKDPKTGDDMVYIEGQGEVNVDERTFNERQHEKDIREFDSYRRGV